MELEKKKEELRGILKEVIQDTLGSNVKELEEKALQADEAQKKLFEENKELKQKLDEMQNKKITLKGNTGEHKYTFKGYNTNDVTKNFKIDCSQEEAEEAIEGIKKALTSANTGSYAIPVNYGDALLGLAELQSVALAKAHIIQLTQGNSLKLPVKGTRATVDAQAFGTANREAGTTLGQLTFTIDKRVGAYELIYADVIDDANFDVVGDWVQPAIAESIGQSFDDEMFNGGNFTTCIADSAVEAIEDSDAQEIANALTYSNLVTIAYSVELERGLNPEWFLPRGAMKDIVKLADNEGRPIFSPVPVSGAPAGTLLGYPINITPAISNTPDIDAIRLAFGDPKKYIIALRQGLTFSMNRYVQEKEGIVQFIGYARADGNLLNQNAFATLIRKDT